jgi:ribokinase
MQELDFLAIGETVVDTFIRLKEAEVQCDSDDEECTISMRYGDKIPFEFSKVVPAVGNSANAAVAASRLGLSSALVTGVGKDRGGEDCLAAFEKERVGTGFIRVADGQETSMNYVLWYGPDRTILVKYAQFVYGLPDPLPAPRAVYLSSVGEASFALHEKLADWLEANPTILFAFQPGTFQMQAGIEKLARIYARADIFVCNKEEYQRILATDEEDPKKLMELMRAKGPKTVFLTDGPKGAYALAESGAWEIGLYPEGENAYERTGAGDAFASTVTAALSLGKSVPEALAWGPVNSAFVVQKVGAQEGLLTREKLEAALKHAPETYRVETI